MTKIKHRTVFKRNSLYEADKNHVCILREDVTIRPKKWYEFFKSEYCITAHCTILGSARRPNKEGTVFLGIGIKE